MPKSRVSRKKLFREFSKIDPKFIQRNDLKNITFLYMDAELNYGLNSTDIEFLFFVYDLEFWTMDYVGKTMMRSKEQLRKKQLYKLKELGLVYKHFDKLSPSNAEQDMFFRDENKFNYRVRYALSQKGRLLVARLYRKMNGEEPFRLSLPSSEHQ
jgi:hypothetical protein